MMGKSCSSQLRNLAVISTLVFTGMGAGLVLGPELSDNTNATDGCQSIDGVVSCGVDTKVEVTVNSVLNIGVKEDGKPDTDYVYNTDTAPATASLNLGTATPGGSFVRNAADVKVTTNSENGYRLTMSTETANPYLFHSDETAAGKTGTPTKSYFKTCDGDYTGSALTDSCWGYSLSNAAGAVSAIPGSASPVDLRPKAGDTNQTTIDGKKYTGEPAGNGSVTKVYFFAKASSTMPAGTYGNSVVFSATEAP